MVLGYPENSGSKDKLEDYEEEEDEEPMGLCCMSGCLTGCSLGLLFIVVLPAGILLSLYSINNKDYGVLSAGIILILVPLVSIPILVAVHYNRRRLRKIRRFRKTKISTVTGLPESSISNNEIINNAQCTTPDDTKIRF